MGNTCGGDSLNLNENNPNLKKRNLYPEINSEIKQDFIGHKIFKSNENQIKYIKLINSINKQNYFIDPKFQLFSQKTRLSRLYNYQHKKMTLFNMNDFQLNNFQQLCVEFSYLTCIFYTFKKHKYLLNKILEIPLLNNYQLYCVELFCNGQQHQVIIDELIPTNNDSLLYLRLLKGNQLWPFFIEKAWCKQIGSYQDAKGLSPQDAFEQITGIPAYSFPINQKQKQSTPQNLETRVINKEWICLVARQQGKNLNSRQVFYIQKIQNKQFYVRSPYIKYCFKNNPTHHTNLNKISYQQLLTNFQFMIVGYHRFNYQSISIEHNNTNAKQFVLYQINNQDDYDISIRFTQFYQGYFKPQNRKFYQYSPVFLELYDSEYNLLEQGCNRSLLGAHSIYLTQNIFTRMKRGIYYLRVSVQFSIKSGYVVIYCQKQKTSIINLKKKQGISKMHQINLQNFQNKQSIQSDDQIWQLRIWQKKNALMIKIHNNFNKPIQLNLDLKNSINIKINDGSKFLAIPCIIKIEAQQSVILEITPQDPRRQFIIKPFDINRLT